MRKYYTIGLDYGSLSCRGVLVCTSDGTIASEEEYIYPHGVWYHTLPDGTKLPPLWAVQHPQDYLDALNHIVPALLQKSAVLPESVIALCVDTTASTVVAVDGQMIPLCQRAEFIGEIHAWPKMWKHHAAWEGAKVITEAVRNQKPTLLERFGGSVGAESLLPKLLQTYREAPVVFDAADTFFECGDWLTSLLIGKEVRSGSYLTCKSLWDPETGYLKGQPFDTLSEKLALRGDSQPVIAWPGQCVGTLSKEMAQRLSLSPSTVVSAPQMDGYAGLPGCGVCGPGVMTMMLGTSNSYMLLERDGYAVEGICAAVPESILPGFTGYAAGQACTGDMLKWFTENCVPAAYEHAAQNCEQDIHTYLTKLAEQKQPGESGLIALDWWNGNKSVLNDTGLSGLLLGMTLTTRPEDIYRALIESTAYGARRVLEAFRHAGATVSSLIASGGIATKNALLMQIYADVLNMPVSVSDCGQTAALGSAMYAAAAAGAAAGGYDSIAEAVSAMSQRSTVQYRPQADAVKSYDQLYKEYLTVHDYFGRGGNCVMERLKSSACQTMASRSGFSARQQTGGERL